MASTPGTNAGSNDQRTQQQLGTNNIKKIWTEIGVTDLLSLLKTVDRRPNAGWALKNDKIHGLCPFHPESKPSFTIDLTKKYAKCFGCQKFYWNPIQFFADFRTQAGGVSTTYIEAVKELKDRFDLKNLPHKAIAEMGKRWRHRQMKGLLYAVMNEELVAALKNPTDPRYGYAQKTIRYLDHRQIRQHYDVMPIGVLPPEMHLENAFKTAATAAKHDPEAMWTAAKVHLEEPYLRDLSWQGALLFFCGENINEVSGIKVRKVPEHIAAPAVVSSVYGSTASAAPAVDKEMRWVKDEMEQHHGLLGLYGTPGYAALLAHQQTDKFVLVEGEFDALNIIGRQIEAKNIGTYVFSGGGGDVQGLDFLKEFGLETAYLVGDNDEGGEKFIKRALEETRSMNMRIFVWPAALQVPGKGKPDPDDAVNHHGLKVVEHEFRKHENYILTHKWASDHALVDLIGVDPADVKLLTAKAATWGVYVRDRAEQDEYLNELQHSHPAINAGLVRSKISAADESEEAFIDRIYAVLRQRLHVIALINDRTSVIIRVYDTITCRLYDFKLQDTKQIMGTLRSIMGSDVYKFVRDNVGEPAFIPSYEESIALNKRFYFERIDALTRFMVEAVGQLVTDIAHGNALRYVGVGFHFKTIVKSDGTTERVAHLVNGMSLFRRNYTEGGESIWRKCPGPSDGNVVIHAEPDHQPATLYPQFVNESDLNQPATMTLRELFLLIYEVLKTGWDFSHHETTCKLMAAFILNIYISDIFDRQPVVMVTAEHSSGKSCLIGGLIGRTAKPAINIVQPALYSDNYTAAGIKNAFNYAQMCACLDEFEDRQMPNDPKSRNVSNTLGLMRPMANDGGMTLQGSNIAGRSVQYSLRMPMLVAGIRSVTLAEDLSRFIFVELNKKEGRDSPDTSILAKFSAEVLQRIKEQSPLVMFNAVQELLKAYAEIKEQYKHGIDVEYGKIARSREQYYGMLAIMKVAGEDYDAFLKDHYRANHNFMERVAQTSLSNDMFRTLLCVPALRLSSSTDSTNRLWSIDAILSSMNPATLNEAGCGVYYDTVDSLIVVVWSTAKHVLLRDTEWFHKDPGHLKTLASRNRHHLSDDLVQRLGVLKRVPMGKVSPLSQISVFRVDDLLMEAEESRKTVVSEGIEDINMTNEYATELENHAPAKNAGANGTSTQSTNPSSGGKSTRVSDDFNV